MIRSFLLLVLLSMNPLVFSQDYPLDEVVLGQWSNGKWYPARISGYYEGLYDLYFLDGDTSSVDDSKIRTFNWDVETRVSCKWQGKDRYYSGVITKIHGASVSINYDDGDKEKTSIKYCRVDDLAE
ncbi:MAG: hypothetical protein HND53_13560 [Proteobacteria bacterium]|nr:hypothetical protein [Pseudomonadota bacterium]